MLHTPSFSSCFGACSALCMKYCSVSNYFTRVYAIYIYIYLFFLFILFTLFFYSYFLFCFFSLSFSFSFSFLFFSFFFLCKSGVIRKLFGLHCFPFNIVGFVHYVRTYLLRKYSFRTNGLYKTCIMGANWDFRLISPSHLAVFQILGYNHTCKCAKHALAGR